MNIAAVICTHNRYDLLPKAIESLCKQTLAKGRYKIIVVDNSPNEQKAAEFKESLPPIDNLEYIYEKQPGLSNARNVGLTRCEADVIAFIDDDAIASEVWLEQLLVPYMTYGAKCGSAGGRVVPIWEAPRPEWLSDDLLGYVSVVDWHSKMCALAPNEWLAGTNISYRADLLRRAGGFRTDLGRMGSILLSNEEIEINDKLRSMGADVYYNPSAQVDHLVPKSRLTREWFRRRAFWQAVSDAFMSKGDLPPNGHDWHTMATFYDTMPPYLRTIHGLFEDINDPDILKWQIWSIFACTRAMLSGERVDI